MYPLKKMVKPVLLLILVSTHMLTPNFKNLNSIAIKISNGIVVVFNTADNAVVINQKILSILDKDMGNSLPEENQLQNVYDSYFLVKESLVKTDSKSVCLNAKKLLVAITAVKMESLKSDEHTVWMKLSKALSADAESISNSGDINKQRKFFKSLSKNLHDLLEVSKTSEPVYYQYCPMEDANWLSREKEIRNPYYGTKMMTCGKTIETL